MALPYYSTPDFTPEWSDSINADTVHRIAAFTCTDQDGQRITNLTFDNKILVANFFFTSCASICPRMMKNMKIVAVAFKNDANVKFISYSVTPNIDSVQRLNRYANHLGINAAQWHLVTGNKNDIYTLARRSYFAEENLGFNSDSSQFLHTEHLLLIDKNWHIRGLYNGTVELEMQRLIADIHTLEKE